jgi:beta-glucanase (GH16 family)
LASGQSDDGAIVWIEDYYDNKDQRTYDVTGKINIEPSEDIKAFFVEGSPFNKGLHKIKLHVDKGSVVIDKITFSLMKEHSSSPISLTQNMDGQEWELVWSDEFEGDSIDESKWTFDFGNWGWGNNELQYYTDNRSENARIEDGILVIEARKNDMGQDWTSTRMTTRGKVSFLYGKIEFRAKVPREKGNWAAGWTLGDDYVDEKSWPYSGEIDIMESVGYEVDNETGDGIAHSTVHTPAYYFKINNQISSTIDVKNIAGEFHTYAVEWTPTEIRGYVNGEQYYVYDKTANELEWPFNKPQNIILNLAMGGGWGGAQGMDESVTSQKLLIDYVRVFGKK